MKDVATGAGTNIEAKIAEVDLNISNITETISNTETALKNFSELFNTDDAKGISANIDKMAKGLSEAAKGLIGVPDATSALNTATTQTVELAKKAQDVFTQVDKSLGIQDARIRNLTEQLADVEAKLSNQ